MSCNHRTTGSISLKRINKNYTLCVELAFIILLSYEEQFHHLKYISKRVNHLNKRAHFKINF